MIVTKVFSRRRGARAIPRMVWSPRSGDMPMKTPTAKESATFRGDSLTFRTSLSLSLNAKVLVPLRFQFGLPSLSVDDRPLSCSDGADAAHRQSPGGNLVQR